MLTFALASFSVVLLLTAVVFAVCARAMTRAWSNAAERVAASLDAGGKALAEAMGGFWEMTSQEDVKFVDLNDFISNKFMEDVEGDLTSRELVLESDM